VLASTALRRGTGHLADEEAGLFGAEAARDELIHCTLCAVEDAGRPANELCRSVIERALSPIVIAMFRLIGPLANRQPELSRVFFDQGLGKTQYVIGEYLRQNFAGLLWTPNYETAGKTCSP